MDLGYKLKQIRNLKRMSQQEIADHLDICQKTYSNYESCKTMPSTSHIIKLCKVLNFDFINYLEGSEGYNMGNNKIKSYSEKIKDNLILSYESILKDKEEIISLLKEKIEQLKRHS